MGGYLGSLIYKECEEFKSCVFIVGMIKDGGFNLSIMCKIVV